MNIQQSSAYSNHDEIWLLIPWYANGSLEGSDHDRVKAHLQVCLVCRRELASQAMLAKHLEHTPSVEISYKPSFERLMSRIHEEEGLRAKANRNRQTHGKSPWLAQWKNSLIANFTPKHLIPVFATGLLAIALALLFGRPPLNEIKTYHTVANPNNLNRFNANDIRVIFAEQVTGQEIGKLIGSIGGSIVDGPSPVGAYTVRVADGIPLAQAISQLRGNKAVVFAEPALPQQTDKPKMGGG